MLAYGTSISLQGAGSATTTLVSNGSGALAFQLPVASSSDTIVTVRDLTLDGGSVTGGCAACVIIPSALPYSGNVSLTLNRVQVIHGLNAGVSVQTSPTSTASLQIFDSGIDNNGTGVHFIGHGSVDIERSLISYNGATGTVLGGIRIDGTAPTTIVNSTIIGNHGSYRAAEIDDNSSSPLDVINSTVGEDFSSALASIYAAAGMLDHVIIAGSCAGVVSGTYSVESPGNTCGLDAHSWVSVSDVHLALGTPADNGGATQTIMPQAGSVAIGIGGTCEPVDQRDFVRSGSCDAGAAQTTATVSDEIFQNDFELVW